MKEHSRRRQEIIDGQDRKQSGVLYVVWSSTGILANSDDHRKYGRRKRPLTDVRCYREKSVRLVTRYSF